MGGLRKEWKTGLGREVGGGQGITGGAGAGMRDRGWQEMGQAAAGDAEYEWLTAAQLSLSAPRRPVGCAVYGVLNHLPIALSSPCHSSTCVLS